MLHVLGDLLQSIGVAIAGLLIWMHEVCGRCTSIYVFYQLILALCAGRWLNSDVHSLLEAFVLLLQYLVATCMTGYRRRQLPAQLAAR